MTQPVPTTTLLDPETGAAIDGVPLAEVGDYVRQGAVVPDGQTIPVNTGKEIVNLSGQEANEFFTSFDSIGANVSTPQAYAAQEERKEYESPLNVGAAGLLGGVRGLSFGTSDLLADQLGAGDYVRKAQQYNPGASLAGEVAGMALPLLLTEGGAGALYAGKGGLGAAQVAGRAAEGASLAGRALEGAALAGRAAEGVGMAAETARGGGLLMRGLEAAAAPTRAVSALGEGAGALASRGLGALGMVEEGLAARSLSTAARMGVEGGFYGMGQAVSESVLKDDPLTVEKLVAGFGQGALLGGVLGGGGTLLAGGAKAGAQKVGSLFRGAGDAAAGTGAKASDKAAELYIRAATGGDAGAASAAQKLWREGLQDSRKVIEAEVKKMAPALDDLTRGIEQASAEYKGGNGGLKFDKVKTAIRSTLGDDGAMAAIDAGLNAVGAYEERLVAMMKQPKAYGGQAYMKQAREIVDETMAKLSKATGADPAEQAAIVFGQLDHLKRFTGKWADPNKFTNSTDKVFAEQFRDLYKGLRGHLEDRAIYGGAADMQKSINAAWSPQIDASRDFGKRFMTEFGRSETDDFARGFRADAGKVEGWAKGLGKNPNALNEEALANYIDRSEAFLKAIRENGDISAASLKQVERAEQGIKAFKARSEEIQKALLEHNALADALEREGTGLGGTPGLLLDIAMRPMTTLSRAASVKEALVKAVSKVDDIGAKAVSALAPLAKKTGQATLAATYEAERVARRTATREQRDKEFTRARDRVAQTVTQPDKVREQVRDVAQVNPRLADAVAKKQVDGAAFLQSKLPPSVASVGLQPKFDKVEPSPAEKDKFLRYAQAVENPMSVLEDAVAGRVSREGVEALRVVYPALYGEMQRMVSERVSSMKRPLTYAEKLQIGTLVGVPADRTFEPANMRDFQAAMSNVIPQDGQGGGGAPNKPAPNLSNGMQTKTAQLEGFR